MFESPGDVIEAWYAHLPEEADQESDRGYAVDVIVAVDDDPLLLVNLRDDEGGRLGPLNAGCP